MAISKAFNNILFSTLLAASFAAVLVAGFQFHVGDKGRGWEVPTGKGPETYNQWAAKNRFHIGDKLYFEYGNDSVLVVNSADYLNCNTSNPISEFEDGKTVFEFGRSGLFYFISGQPGHCNLGQRLIVRVIHPSDIGAPPALAPSPAPGGDSGGSSDDGRASGTSSGEKLPIVSGFVAALLGIFVMVYMFM